MNSILNRFEFRLEADKPTELNLYLYSQVRGGLAYDLAKGKFEESKTGASYFPKSWKNTRTVSTSICTSTLLAVRSKRASLLEIF